MIYIFGSLANTRIPEITNTLRAAGFEVFSEWHAAGPEGDRWWKEYFASQGLSYKEMLSTAFVETAFNFDLDHMQRADIGVLVMPAGRSGHMEIGWMLGRGKKGYILYPDGEPERPDLMVKLATDICFSVEELLGVLRHDASKHIVPEISYPNNGICLHPNRRSDSDHCPDCKRVDWGV